MASPISFLLLIFGKWCGIFPSLDSPLFFFTLSIYLIECSMSSFILSLLRFLPLDPNSHYLNKTASPLTRLKLNSLLSWSTAVVGSLILDREPDLKKLRSPLMGSPNLGETLNRVSILSCPDLVWCLRRCVD